MRLLTTLAILLTGTVLLAQSGSIFDISTGNRCIATFTPTTAATDVQIDCSRAGATVLSGAKVKLAAITGSGNAFTLQYNLAGDAVTMQMQRPTATGPLHVDVIINGTSVFPPSGKDVTVP